MKKQSVLSSNLGSYEGGTTNHVEQQESLSIEDVKEITEDTQASKPVEHNEEQKIMQQWEANMADFVPDYSLKTTLQSFNEEVSGKPV